MDIGIELSVVMSHTMEHARGDWPVVARRRNYRVVLLTINQVPCCLCTLRFYPEYVRTLIRPEVPPELYSIRKLRSD